MYIFMTTLLIKFNQGGPPVTAAGETTHIHIIIIDVCIILHAQ